MQGQPGKDATVLLELQNYSNNQLVSKHCVRFKVFTVVTIGELKVFWHPV